MTAARPDPNRLGGLAWTRRTGGRLTRGERARLLAAIGRGQWDNVLGRAKLALGWLKHPGFDAHPISCDRCASRSGGERSP